MNKQIGYFQLKYFQRIMHTIRILYLFFDIL